MELDPRIKSLVSLGSLESFNSCFPILYLMLGKVEGGKSNSSLKVILHGIEV